MPDLAAVQPQIIFPSKGNRKQGIMGDGANRAVGNFGSISNSVTGSSAWSKVTDGTTGTGGWYLKALTGTTSGNLASLYSYDLDFRLEGCPKFLIKIRAQGTTTSMRLFCGLKNGSEPVNNATGFAATGEDGILFGFGENDTNWMLRNANNGTVSSVSTGIAVSDTNWHTIAVIVEYGSSSFTWQLDGGSINKITTNFPRSLSYQFYFLDVATQTAAAKEAHVTNAEVEEVIV